MSFMFRKCLIILMIFITIYTVSYADGLKLSEDTADTIVYPYYEDRENSPTYTYSYCYPCIDSSEACAAEINSFYSERISITLDFDNPVLVDYLSGTGNEISSSENVSYTLHCNNGVYFSILIRKYSVFDGEESLIYEAHTFDTIGGNPGSTVTLPYLLGLLEKKDNDTWLQDRQTQKAESITRELVWEALQEKVDAGELVLFDDIDEDYLTDNFFPEEAYYLDENGDPVFFFQPGWIAGPEYGLIELPVALETLCDEF